MFFACGVVCRENEEEEEEEKKPARLPERMFMEALFDYEAQQQQELSIQAGEKLKARRDQYLWARKKNMQARQVWWLCKKRYLCLSAGFMKEVISAFSQTKTKISVRRHGLFRIVN